MILKLNENNYSRYIGLYGCEDKYCEDFDLSNDNIRQKIHSIHLYNDDGSGVKSFLGMDSKYDYLNSFLKLECGRGYVIVLKKGVGNVEIPNLRVFTDKSEPFLNYHDDEIVTNKHKIGDYFYSTKKMFKYKVSDVNLYETSYYLEELHQMFDFWENAISHPDHDYIHEVNIIFSDLESEFGGEYKNVLAMASPTLFDKAKSNWEFGNTFPIQSVIYVNLSNLEYMKSQQNHTGDNLYLSTLKHELAHSLGLNYYSMNEFKNTPVGQYIDVNDKKTKYYYHGDNALREYRSYFEDNGGLIGVPLDDDTVQDRIPSHWEEGIGIDRYINGILHPALTTAMMTPYLDEHASPLTKILLGFLEDYGYSVDYSKADLFH